MRRERAEHSDGVYWLPAAHLVLNFRDPAPPSPRGVLAYATPRRLPFRLITRNLSSGMWPSFFSSFSKSALNAASASTIASKDFFTSAGKSSASIFCHFNSSRAMLCSNLVGRKFQEWCAQASRLGQQRHRRPRRASDARPDRPESGRKFQPMVPVATCDGPTFSPNGRLWNSSLQAEGSTPP